MEYSFILKRVIDDSEREVATTGDVLMAPTGLLIRYLSSWLPVSRYDSSLAVQLTDLCRNRNYNVNDLSDIMVQFRETISDASIGKFEFYNWQYTTKAIPDTPVPIRTPVESATYEAIPDFGIF